MAGRDDALKNAGRDSEGTCLDPVDQDPDVPGEQRDRRPEANEQQRDASVPHLVRPEAEGDHRDPVPDRRDSDRAGQGSEVGVADRHCRTVRQPEN